PVKPERMLEEVGSWMEVNGEAVYGSKAWTTYGEGQLDKDGHLRKLPGHALGKHHAEFPFTAQDIRFTVGKNGNLYAFCMKSPEANQTITIKTMGKSAGNIAKIKKVSLLGYDGKLKWRQTADALEITAPATIPFATCVVFRVE
ncbi:MAG: alpha-L-fucosidase, partial [Bacteroidales bacterium]|nr:alpha-L-fucosidase [Bacteroidales bacterium]